MMLSQRSHRIARMGNKRRHADGNWWTRSTGGMVHWLAVAVVVAGVVSISIAYVNSPRNTAPAEATTPAPVEVLPSPTASMEPKVAAFLGDSYSPAMGQAIADYNFAAIMSKRLGWEAIPFGQGGTGYTNPGQAEEGDSVFADRVDAVIAAAPDVVIVQGSTNDRDYDATLKAAGGLLASLRAGLPDATIIAVGPLLTPTLGAAAVEPTRDAVRDAATAAGIPFVDPLQEEWLSGDDSLFVADGIHPSGTGQAEIAKRLTAAVQAIQAS
jgi:lysophospholipase L1-like esterase